LLPAAATNRFASPQTRRIDLRPFVQPHVVPDLEAIRELRVEADTLEAQDGPNAYSNYLRKHGRRPTRQEAAGMGRLFGGRVLADDGTLQPPLDAADRAARNRIREEQKAYARRYEQIADLKFAIATLARFESNSKSGFIDCVLPLDDPALFSQVEDAVKWLNRFAERWHGQQQKPSTQD
jgi:hypothetical protein